MPPVADIAGGRVLPANPSAQTLIPAISCCSHTATPDHQLQQQLSDAPVAMTDDNEDLNRRLKELRGRQEPKLGLHELQERIGKLKGLGAGKYTAPPITVYPAPDRRSDSQKCDDLLSQLMHETRIDQDLELVARRSSDAEIEQRLRRLNDDQPIRPSVLNSSPAADVLSSDSEEEIEKLVLQAVAEAHLPLNDAEEVEMESSGCVICGDDATVSCRDCDNDCYCSDCFSEFHSNPDSRKHRKHVL